MNRLAIAFVVYVALGVLAWSTLGDEKIRLGTMVVLGLFAIKTLLHRTDSRSIEREERREGPM